MYEFPNRAREVYSNCVVSGSSDVRPLITNGAFIVNPPIYQYEDGSRVVIDEYEGRADFFDNADAEPFDFWYVPVNENGDSTVSVNQFASKRSVIVVVFWHGRVQDVQSFSSVIAATEFAVSQESQSHNGANLTTKMISVTEGSLNEVTERHNVVIAE